MTATLDRPETAEPTRLTVRVTEAHINAGTPENGEHCPIALALSEQCFPTSYVWVDLNEVRVTDERGDVTVYPLPAAACDFIELFDAGEFYPLALTFELVEEEPA